MYKVTFLCLLAGITFTKLVAQPHLPEGQNIEDSGKIYIKQFKNATNGEIAYKSPVFFAFGDNQEKLIVQLNTAPSKNYIEITFLVADLRCSSQAVGKKYQ